METPIVIGSFAGLLIIISLLQPLARRFGVAPSVLLAMVGTLIGVVSTYLLYTPDTNAFNAVALVFVDPPLDAEMILYIFLPILLFQTTLTLDVRRIFEDIAPILLMAVVAVLVATAFIGFALYPLSSVPLVACLLLGAIVATTDPVAVVAIFRDIGAPARLGRIVEGESLLNDAAAIVLFVILLGILTGQQEPDAAQATMAFFRSFLGGVIVGAICARIGVMMLPIMRDLPLAQVTLSLALPYGIYVFSDQFADVSAVVAVVSAGILFNLYGPARIAPESWEFLHDVWEQIAFWASSLIFILAAVLIPKLVNGFTPIDILLLAVLVAAAFAARAVVIFGLLPVLSLIKAGQSVSHKYKTVMLWGGMRGAVTLTLALSVSEHPSLAQDVSEYVAKLSTAFVLFTLLVYGISLKPLIKLLGLDQLSPRDQAIRSQFLALALSDVKQGVENAAEAYHIEPRITERVTRDYDTRAASALEETAALEELKDKDRVTLGLIALADRERQLVLDHFHEKTIASRAVSLHLTVTGRISDLTRSEGRVGYNRASRMPLKFSRGFRLAQWLQRRLKIKRPLATLLADRFEFLLVCRIMAGELIEFNRTRIRPLVGERVGDILHDTLCARRDDIHKAIEALRLQYPDYADALETLFLRKTGLRLEETAYAEAREQTLIGAELHNDLSRDIDRVRAQTYRRPNLDLGLKTRDLVASHPLFEGLSAKRKKMIMKKIRPYFATPGEKLINRGDRGDAAYFIASGAVEVRLPNQTIRLGRGDIFGEIALLTGARRTADVIALGYCQLLRLKANDFRELMKKAPDIKQRVKEVSKMRQAVTDNIADVVDSHREPEAAATKPAADLPPVEGADEAKSTPPTETPQDAKLEALADPVQQETAEAPPADTGETGAPPKRAPETSIADDTALREAELPMPDHAASDQTEPAADTQKDKQTIRQVEPAQ
ncbi:sodium/proton antiporter (CPA1 family) [Roseibium hamelinense]|uniref:Sodium/proton antiporter (CPA1 family) n=1 Tax=Roseibium hamelinense TaxID=150831 RepID=A0A562TKD0_9HYPH|nr:cation:proton antiporter [Roseibium hamelinense]MTI42772.1 cyclic nucleotide-binding domain-containing protein [Roseibium hamelinense]TWI93420.1 sodium/proton antiporter (CPA1 family) [Roseibium hamelinense]